jgi:hypothetical protein
MPQPQGAAATRTMPAISPGEITVFAATVVILIFSFVKWFGAGDFTANAWDDGNFPVALIPLLMALFATGALALAKFAGVKLPERPLGYTWEHLYLNAGFFAALFMTLFVITDTSDKKIGVWLTWLGSLALLVGAFLVLRERRPEALKR